jgi:hypothetical protein
LLLEVTSDSTEDYDPGEKLEHYKQLPGLEVVLFLIDARRSLSSSARPKVGAKGRSGLAKSLRYGPRRCGEDAHEAGARAAVDEVVAGSRNGVAHGCGRFAIGLCIAEARTAVDTDASHGHGVVVRDPPGCIRGRANGAEGGSGSDDCRESGATAGCFLLGTGVLGTAGSKMSLAVSSESAAWLSSAPRRR